MRKLPVAVSSAPTMMGPTKAVDLPEKAKKPKNSVRSSAGLRRAISERLAAWAGPTKMPSAEPQTQNQVTSWARMVPPAVTISPPSARKITCREPKRSSSQPKAAAPSPAVTLSTMPKRITSSNSKSWTLPA